MTNVFVYTRVCALTHSRIWPVLIGNSGCQIAIPINKRVIILRNRLLRLCLESPLDSIFRDFEKIFIVGQNYFSDRVRDTIESSADFNQYCGILI